MMFGAGGTAVEVLRDTAHALPPLDLNLARELMRQTRVWRLLQGYRDRPAGRHRCDRRGAGAAQLPRGRPSRDPRNRHQSAACRRQGRDCARRRVRVADARGEPARADGDPALPVGMGGERDVDGSGPRLLRPIRPEDEALYEEFFASVTPDDQRLRFFTAAPRSLAPVSRAPDADRLRARDGVRGDRTADGRPPRRGAPRSPIPTTRRPSTRSSCGPT